MKPNHVTAKIFLDGGNPRETRRLKEKLGFLDGQTTNPTLVSENPKAEAREKRGDAFTNEELLGFYKDVVREISSIIPEGSVSVEVYADKNTTAERMLEQGREMFSWIPNAHIKYPTTKEGLKAAQQSVREGMRVNMTLCFTQRQAAAVYAATAGAKKGDVFVSPFIGRLDDRGRNGMDLIANVLEMYEAGDGHVEVLTASVRSVEHIKDALALGTDILTAPAEHLEEWAEAGMPVSEERSERDLAPIPYEELDLTASWEDMDLGHELTDKGMERFSKDWNDLLGGKAS